MNRKIFIGYMNTQNISKYYGSRLTIVVDSSETFDFELVNIDEGHTLDVVLDYSEFFDFELTSLNDDN